MAQTKLYLTEGHDKRDHSDLDGDNDDDEEVAAVRKNHRVNSPLHEAKLLSSMSRGTSHAASSVRRFKGAFSDSSPAMNQDN
jgi:hypothetical protein